MVVPGVVIGFLLLVPFLDRAADRHPFSRSRRAFTAVFVAIGIGVGALTAVGLSDRPRESTVVTNTFDDDAAVAKDIYDTVCFACHKLGGDGGTVGPNLTHVGSRRDYDKLRAIIADPLAAYDESVMPPFEDKLSADQINALARYLASLK